MMNYCNSQDKCFKGNTCGCTNNWKNNNWDAKEECQEFKCCCSPVEKKEPEHSCKFCCQFEKKENNNCCQNKSIGWSNSSNQCNCGQQGYNNYQF